VKSRRYYARRALNVAVAVLGLLVALPLMLVIAAAIKLDSDGPVIYRQPRIGQDRRSGRPGGNGRRHVDYGGRPFTIYKFRTMTTQPAAQQTWARRDDPRITSVGAVLRQLRLDELPQLVNVILGDMNLVGPRPEQPEIVLRLTRQVAGYAARHRVLPGITGWAQVNQHYDSTVEDVRRKVAYDLEYIRNESALQDLKIMARTVPVMLGRGGW
jgi:lipopolysaccharide/colanic/teichoic acid biosynthesis glycosyltransferase